jgi:hypothetical protein
VLVSLAGGAWAGSGRPPMEGPGRRACRFEIRRFCPDVEPGHGRIERCLERHWDELSPACRDQLGERKR